MTITNFPAKDEPPKESPAEAIIKAAARKYGIAMATSLIKKDTMSKLAVRTQMRNLETAITAVLVRNQAAVIEQCINAMCAYCKSGPDHYPPASFDGLSWIHEQEDLPSPCGANVLRRALKEETP